MWKSAAYEETVFEAAGESSALWFGAVKKGVPGFLAFMASYNETGMVVECHDRWCWPSLHPQSRARNNQLLNFSERCTFSAPVVARLFLRLPLKPVLFPQN